MSTSVNRNTVGDVAAWHAGTRFWVGQSALTMAEYFHDDAHQDVLMLIDNIFRFIQTGTEVSGRMQPNRY